MFDFRTVSLCIVAMSCATVREESAVVNPACRERFPLIDPSSLTVSPLVRTDAGTLLAALVLRGSACLVLVADVGGRSTSSHEFLFQTFYAPTSVEGKKCECVRPFVAVRPGTARWIDSPVAYMERVEFSHHLNSDHPHLQNSVMVEDALIHDRDGLFFRLSNTDVPILELSSDTAVCDFLTSKIPADPFRRYGSKPMEAKDVTK